MGTVMAAIEAHDKELHRKSVEPQPIAREAQLAPAPEPAGHEQIAMLAYQLWHDRGCPEGSPEVDWFEAENQLQTGDGRVVHLSE